MPKKAVASAAPKTETPQVAFRSFYLGTLANLASSASLSCDQVVANLVLLTDPLPIVDAEAFADFFNDYQQSSESVRRTLELNLTAWDPASAPAVAPQFDKHRVVLAALRTVVEFEREVAPETDEPSDAPSS